MSRRSLLWRERYAQAGGKLDQRNMDLFGKIDPRGSKGTGRKSRWQTIRNNQGRVIDIRRLPGIPSKSTGTLPMGGRKLTLVRRWIG